MQNLHGAFFMPKFQIEWESEGNNMMEHQKILRKIEQLIDQLPYRSVRIEIEFKDQTLTLDKQKESAIGFLKKP